MLLFEKFKAANYTKAGNWFMHNYNVSVNLFTKEIKSTKKDVYFSYIFKDKVDFDRCEEIRLFIESF